MDGGTTAYNNPAFLLYRMAIEPAFGLEWARGEQNILLVSIGTGWAPETGQTSDDPEQNVLAAVKQTLSALMNQAAFDQDLSCRTVGRCVAGLPLDRELGDLVLRDARRRPPAADGGPPAARSSTRATTPG